MERISLLILPEMNRPVLNGLTAYVQVSFP